MKIKTKLFVATAGIMSAGILVGAPSANAGEIATDGGTQWEVEQGDTLAKIADNYGVDYTEIHESNPSTVADPNMIYVGDVLDIPVKTQQQEEIEEYFGSRNQEDVVAQEQEVEEVEQAPESEPVQEQEAEEVSEPVPEPEPEPEVEEPAQSSTSDSEPDSNSAKAWIANKESTNNYNAQNGRYYGKFQLDESYLNGDHSPENQEKVADQYVADRYGSWENAKSAHLQQGWY